MRATARVCMENWSRHMRVEFERSQFELDRWPLLMLAAERFRASHLDVTPGYKILSRHETLSRGWPKKYVSFVH